jgi:hypothetical protein
MVEGDTVQETLFTSYQSLGPLIDLYNSRLAAGERQFQVDTDVVKMRDAIAHALFQLVLQVSPKSATAASRASWSLAPASRISR